MALQHFARYVVVSVVALLLTGCGGGGIGNSLGSIGRGLFGGGAPAIAPSEDVFLENATSGTPPPVRTLAATQAVRRGLFRRPTIDPNTAIQVNKYIWAAALEVLDFLPLRSADPFTGVIVTGYGTPPGGGRAYRATIFIQDPALDARSLRIAFSTRGGPVSADTFRALEDAILTRARQLRIGDARL